MYNLAVFVAALTEVQYLTSNFVEIFIQDIDFTGELLFLWNTPRDNIAHVPSSS